MKKMIQIACYYHVCSMPTAHITHVCDRPHVSVTKEKEKICAGTPNTYNVHMCLLFDLQ